MIKWIQRQIKGFIIRTVLEDLKRNGALRHMVIGLLSE